MPSSSFDELRRLAAGLEARRARARARAALLNVGSRYYVGIVGLESEVQEFEFHGDALRLRAVEEPPGEIALAAALKQKAIFGALGRYSQSIGHEIVADRDVLRGDQSKRVSERIPA